MTFFARVLFATILVSGAAFVLAAEPARARDHAGSESAVPAAVACADTMNHPVCLATGDKAPRFELRNFGNVWVRLTNYSYEGAEIPRKPRQPVVVDFFAIDCPVCVRMLDPLRKFAKDNAGKVQVILIAIPDADDRGNKRLKNFFARNPVPFPVLVDPKGVEAAKWVPVTDGQAELPYLFLIDGSGVVRGAAGGGHESVEAALPVLGTVVAR